MQFNTLSEVPQDSFIKCDYAEELPIAAVGGGRTS